MSAGQARVLRTPDLSTADVAHELSCSLKTVLRLAKTGKLPGYKVGRDWRFRRSAVDAFRRPIDPSPTTRAEQRVTAQRGSELPGWHDFD